MRGHFHDVSLLDSSKITVTEVRVSPDLKYATAYVIALGGADMSESLPALNDAAAEFQREINRQSSLKFTPKIRFVLDESFEAGQRMDALLSNLHYSDQNDA